MSMLKNVVKFILVLLVIVVVGAGLIYGVQYWRYRTSPEYRTLSDIKDWGRQYAEDPYGGSTPEETLKLFIDALKKGDTNLAAKYFVIDKQAEWQEDLAKLQEKGLLDEMIRDLEKASYKTDSDIAFFVIKSRDKIDSQLVMHKNPQNNRWKITEL